MPELNFYLPWPRFFAVMSAMSKAGVPGRTELLIGKGHGWGDPEMRHTQTETFTFFDRYLKPAKTP